MALKFKVYRKLISREEKIERANDYNEFNGFKKNELGYINPEKFAEQDIYDEFIDFKCSSCGYEETLEVDIVLMRNLRNIHCLLVHIVGTKRLFQLQFWKILT